MTVTTVGALGSRHQVHVDARGRIEPLDHDWSLDWWVGADDRWHIPAHEPAVRQSLVDAAPVTRTAVRVPHGDAVQHVYGVGGPGDPIVVDVTNESPVPFVVALVVSGAHRVEVDATTVAVDGHPTLWLTRAPSRWAASTDGTTQAQVRAGDARSGPFPPHRDRDGRLDVALLHPVAHRTRLRTALRPGRDAPPELERLPDPDAAARGWQAQLARGLQVDVPDDRFADALRSARAQALLAAARPPADPLVVAALEDWGFDPEARAAWPSLSWKARRVAAARAATPPHWADVVAATHRGGAPLLLAARALLAHETDAATITLLAEVPPHWRGHGIEVHDAPTRHGPLSYAVRWHGARPALLWDAPPGVTLLAPGLDPTWHSDTPRGDALLDAAVA
jgi:hypothetical protein